MNLFITTRRQQLRLFNRIAPADPSPDHSLTCAQCGHQLYPIGLATPSMSTEMNLAVNNRARPPVNRCRHQPGVEASAGPFDYSP